MLSKLCNPLSSVTLYDKLKEFLKLLFATENAVFKCCLNLVDGMNEICVGPLHLDSQRVSTLAPSLSIENG